MADAEDDDEIINEFVTESLELLDELDRQFVALEANPDSRERLAAIFRVVHTIKGTSGLLGYGRLEKVTHVAENVLVKLRDGEMQLTPEITSALLKSADAAREMLGRIAQTRAEGDVDYALVLSGLKAVLETGAAPAPRKLAPAAPPAAGRAPAPIALPSPTEIRPALPVPPPPLELLTPPSLPATGAKTQGPRVSVAPISAQRAAAPRESEAPREGNVRVSVGLLDRLMNLVGELVLARNQVLQGSARSIDPGLLASAQRLNLITSELQEGIMKTRMQAIGSVWTKFPRIVRDLAIACGKQVRLELIGADTDLDRSVVEAIRDPLTHMVRNSVDHGIEAPEVRAQAGKVAGGTIVFRAFHEGGMVNIEVSDDGGGVDLQRVRAKAVERNLISAERAASLSDREALQLLFLPGFSTAKQVTNVSGRGVGMDVVKTSIEKIGGTVEIHSKLGEGTVIRIKIPLTLAIIPALIVRCRTQRYAIPQVNLIELVRVESNAIEYAREAPVYRLRGELLPLVFLRQVFGDRAAEAPRKEHQVIVVRADNKVFGLVVDDIDDTQEIVVKPLGRELKGVPAFAGATILGDGRIALILDVFGIALTVGMSVCAIDHAPLPPPDTLESEPRSLLMFDFGAEQRMALFLESVERLEEFRRDRVERAGSVQVIQYGRQILRLLHLQEVLGQPPPQSAPDTLQVVVHSRDGKSLGLVVDRIADIIQDRVVIDGSVRRPGVLGAAVLQGSVTEIFDIDAAWRLLDARQQLPRAELR
jgi:two-component system, chemotaxis family, sensor kinase CheA